MFIADVVRSIEVCVNLIAAGTAEELRLRLTIRAMLKTAARAGLGSMPGVNSRNCHVCFFGFVAEERAHLSEAPRVQASLAFALPGPGPTSNLSQILDYDSRSCGSRLNNTFREYVVTIAVESLLAVRHLFEAAFSRLRSFQLQSTLEAKIATVDFFPVSLAKKLSVRGNGGVIESEINANCLSIGDKLDIGQGEDDVQVETTFTVNKVGGSRRITDVLDSVFGNIEADNKPVPWRCGKINFLLIPRQFEGVHVVASWAKLRMWLFGLAPRLLPGSNGLECFGSLYPGLNNQIADNLDTERLRIIVSTVVQANPVLLAVLPTIFADEVKGSRERLQRVLERSFLFGGRVKFQANGSLHEYSLPYIKRLCNKEVRPLTGRARLSLSPKGRQSPPRDV